WYDTATSSRPSTTALPACGAAPCWAASSAIWACDLASTTSADSPPVASRSLRDSDSVMECIRGSVPVVCGSSFTWLVRSDAGCGARERGRPRGLLIRHARRLGVDEDRERDGGHRLVHVGDHRVGEDRRREEQRRRL